MLKLGSENSDQAILQQFHVAYQEDEASAELCGILVLQVAPCYYQVDANGHEEEWERDRRTRNRYTCCSCLIDLEPFFTVKLDWDAALAGCVNIESVWANQANKNALIDGLVVWFKLQGTVIDACVVVQKQLSDASGAGVGRVLATCARLLAFATYSIQRYLSSASAAVLASAIQV